MRDTREPWDGVRNPLAMKHMRAVRTGDQAYIYHTGKERQIVGLATVVCDPYEDPSAPGLNADGDPKAPLFDVAPVKAAKTPVTLAEIKADERFAEFVLVRQSRLSVMPVPAPLDKLIRKMAGF